MQQQAENLAFKVIENAIAAFLLGMIFTVGFCIHYFKVAEKWDRTNDLLEEYTRTNIRYKRLLLKRGIVNDPDTDNNL
jgi:uncharacterized membrane protein affecting hemolysin expression